MLRFLNAFFEVIGWLLIVASPSLGAILIGGILYYLFPSNLVIFFAVILFLVGLILGILWANRVRKNTGTIRYLSSLMEMKGITGHPTEK